MVHTPEHIKKYSPFGIVVGHLDFLTYNALFLVNARLCEIGFLYKVKQYFQGFLIVL